MGPAEILASVKYGNSAIQRDIEPLIAIVYDDDADGFGRVRLYRRQAPIKHIKVVPGNDDYVTGRFRGLNA